jgi:hypothetical protein
MRLCALVTLRQQCSLIEHVPFAECVFTNMNVLSLQKTVEDEKA